MLCKLIHVFLFVLLMNSLETTAKNSPILYLKDVDIENTVDATPIIVEILAKHVREGFTQLAFPKGIYHFCPTYNPDKYCATFFNYDKWKASFSSLLGFNDFEIEGNEYELIFHWKIGSFILEGSANLTAKKLNNNREFPYCLADIFCEQS